MCLVCSMCVKGFFLFHMCTVQRAMQITLFFHSLKYISNPSVMRTIELQSLLQLFRLHFLDEWCFLHDFHPQCRKYTAFSFEHVVPNYFKKHFTDTLVLLYALTYTRIPFVTHTHTHSHSHSHSHSPTHEPALTNTHQNTRIPFVVLSFALNTCFRTVLNSSTKTMTKNVRQRTFLRDEDETMTS